MMKTRRNKYVGILSAMAIALTSNGRMATAKMTSASATETSSVCLWGDIDRNGQVDVDDALHVLQKYSNELAMKTYDFAQSNWAVADVNSDGEIDVNDSILILKKYVNRLAYKDFYFPVESPIKYGKEIVAKESWYYWEDYSTNNPAESQGYISPGEIFKLEEYVGQDWYLSVIEADKTAYIYIPQEKWGKSFDYYEEETVVTTTVSQNTTETTTTTTTSTSETTAVTTSSETVSSTVSTEITTETTVTETTFAERQRFEVGDKLKFVLVSIRYYETDETGYDQPSGWLPGGTEFTIMTAKYRPDKRSDRYKVQLNDGKVIVIYISNPEWFEVMNSEANSTTATSSEESNTTTTTTTNDEVFNGRLRYKQYDHLTRLFGSFDYYKNVNGHDIVAGSLPEGTEVIIEKATYRDDKDSDRYEVSLMDGTNGIVIYIGAKSSFMQINDREE